MRCMQRLGLDRDEAHWTALEPWTAPKPKRMRWRTYETIVGEAAAAEEQRMAALLPRFERFLVRLSLRARR